jgi:hypothetical protein
MLIDPQKLALRKKEISVSVVIDRFLARFFVA